MKTGHRTLAPLALAALLAGGCAGAETTVPSCAVAGAPIGELAFSSDGAQLAAAHADGQVTVVRLGDGRARRLRVTSGERARVALTEDGALLAVGSAGKVTLWNVAAGTVARELPVGSGPIVSLKFSDSPQPFLLASVTLPAGGRENLKIWRIADGVLVGLATGAAQATFTHADEALLLLDEPGQRFELVSFQGTPQGMAHLPRPLSRTAFAADGAFLAGVIDAGTAQERLATIAVDETTFVWESAPRRQQTRALVFLENPSRVLQLGERAIVHDHADGQVIAELPALDSATVAAAIPDGSGLAAVDPSGGIILVSASVGGEVRPLPCDLP